MSYNILALDLWATIHETDLRIAGAIYELAGGDPDDMEGIWHEPTDDDLAYIMTCVNKYDRETARWGRQTLASMLEFDYA